VTQTPAVPTSDVDLWSVENPPGPFAASAELRALGPVVWLDRPGVFALTRFDAVRGALQDWRTYSASLKERGRVKWLLRVCGVDGVSGRAWFLGGDARRPRSRGQGWPEATPEGLWP
jgi:cytochrome P450